MVDHGTRENGLDAEIEDWCRLQDVLVEDIQRCERIPPVRLTAMDKQKILEELELADCIIRCFDSLLAFETTYSDSDMRCIDHIDIISTITNSQGHFFTNGS